MVVRPRREGRFGYAPEAMAWVLAPSSYRDWARQKLRCRLGWAAPALHPGGYLGTSARMRTVRSYPRTFGSRSCRARSTCVIIR